MQSIMTKKGHIIVCMHVKSAAFSEYCGQKVPRFYANLTCRLPNKLMPNDIYNGIRWNIFRLLQIEREIGSRRTRSSKAAGIICRSLVGL